MSEELLGSYDEIIFMEDGCIIEKGSLNELLDKQSKFFDFYTLDIGQKSNGRVIKNC